MYIQPHNGGWLADSIRPYGNQGCVLNISRKLYASSAKQRLQQSYARSLRLRTSLTVMWREVSALFFLITILSVNMSLSSTDTQDLRPVSRSKRKRGSLQLPDGAGPSFASPSQFAVLSDGESDAEDIGVSSPPSSGKPRIPPFVIYSYRNSHSATPRRYLLL
jgi:hypothetical protein